MKSRYPLPVLAVIAALGLTAPAANATVFIGLQQDAGPIFTVASDATGFVNYSGAFGQFERVAVTASGQPDITLPNLLQATTLQNNNAGPANAGTLTIYVTSTGNAPLGVAAFESGFATVSLKNSWTETLRTYLDPGNGIYVTTPPPLGSATFNTVGSDTANALADSGSGSPYSVTAVFTITAPSRGIASSEIGIADAPIPEPASLALLGAALAGFGIAARRRRKAD